MSESDLNSDPSDSRAHALLLHTVSLILKTFSGNSKLKHQNRHGCLVSPELRRLCKIT